MSSSVSATVPFAKNAVSLGGLEVEGKKTSAAPALVIAAWKTTSEPALLKLRRPP